MTILARLSSLALVPQPECTNGAKLPCCMLVGAIFNWRLVYSMEIRPRDGDRPPHMAAGS